MARGRRVAGAGDHSTARPAVGRRAARARAGAQRSRDRWLDRARRPAGAAGGADATASPTRWLAPGSRSSSSLTGPRARPRRIELGRREPVGHTPRRRGRGRGRRRHRPELLAPLGLRLSIAAAKGYSRTYPADPTGPRTALYLESPKVAVSAYDGAVRVSGTLELGARGLALSATGAWRRSRRRPRRDAGLADARPADTTGRGCARCRPTACRSSGAVPGLDRPSRRGRARDARDHAGAADRRAASDAAARRAAEPAAGRVRSLARDRRARSCTTTLSNDRRPRDEGRIRSDRHPLRP